MSEIRKLAQATSVLAITSVECERAFSAMNVVKTEVRNKMSNNTLNNLITVRMHGPTIHQFPFAEVVSIWHRMVHRRIQFQTPVPVASSRSHVRPIGEHIRGENHVIA